MLIDYGPSLINLFEALLSVLNQLNAHIQTDLKGLPVWVVANDENRFEANRAKITFALANFGPTMGLTAQETFKCPGVVACTAVTLRLIGAVNEAKSAFKKLVGDCHQQEKYQDIPKFVRDILAHTGYPGIKLKQVFRHIPAISYHPRRIAWSKGKHTTSKYLSKHDSEQLLNKAGQGRHIEIQKIKLSRLNNKTKLIKHRSIKAGWVVNIGTFKKHKRSHYEDIRTALPLFYLHDPRLAIPLVCFSQQRDANRKIRADKLIESIPFLPSISVYRYKTKISNKLVASK